MTEKTNDEGIMSDSDFEQAVAEKQAWAEAQNRRAEALPGILIQTFGAATFALPEGFSEGQNGLVDLRGKDPKTVCTGPLRPVARLVDETGRNVVAHYYVLSNAPKTADEEPVWRHVVARGDQAVSGKAMRGLVLSQGLYFKGNDDTLIALWSNRELPSIQLVSSFGRITNGSSCCFVLGDVVITARGVRRYDATSGLIRLGKQVMLVDSGNMPQSRPQQGSLVGKGKASLKQLLEEVEMAFAVQGLLALAFVVAGLHRQDFTNANRGFPLLLAEGQRASGKTTLLRVASALCGTTHLGLGSGETTVAGLRRTLNALDGLSIRVDDLRRDGEEKFLNLLLAAFDGTGSARADRDNVQATVNTQARANVMLAAEALPHDHAAVSRMAVLEMPPKNADIKLDGTHLQQLAAAAGAYVMQECAAGRTAGLPELAEALGAKLSTGDSRQRTDVWGPLLAGLQEMLKLAGFKAAAIKARMKAALTYAEGAIQRASGRGWVDTFFDELAQMAEAGNLSLGSDVFRVDDLGALVTINFGVLFARWTKHRLSQHQRILYTDREMRRDLKALPAMMDPSVRVRAHGGKLWHGMVFNTSTGLPGGLVALIEQHAAAEGRVAATHAIPLSEEE